jgi:hypothetical protein
VLDIGINSVEEKSEQTETLTYIEFEVLTAEITNSTIFWVTPCSLVEFIHVSEGCTTSSFRVKRVSQTSNQKEASRLVTWTHLQY